MSKYISNAHKEEKLILNASIKWPRGRRTDVLVGDNTRILSGKKTGISVRISGLRNRSLLGTAVADGNRLKL